tara:strand:+ start:2852 stop:3595 length:744 start_codon:yes stop_codon:yes gene_type:complete
MNKLLLISLVLFFTICSKSWALPECEGSPKIINSLSELSTWNNCVGTFNSNALGVKYTGGFKNGLLHGEGKMFFKNDKVFIGTWENNEVKDGYKTTNSKIRQKELEKEVSFDDAKIMCEELGFKVRTEKFGECVLELTKRDTIFKESTESTALQTKVLKELQEQNKELQKELRLIRQRQNSQIKADKNRDEKEAINKAKRSAPAIDFNPAQTYVDKMNEASDLITCINQCLHEDYTRPRAYCERMCR